MKTHAIIASAGSGTRMGRGGDKPFIALAGKPLLCYALSVFDSSPEIDGIVLVVREELIGKARELVGKSGFRKVGKIVAGGDTRTRSVRNALAAIEGTADDIVLVHDAARPFVTVKMIADAVRAAKEEGAAVIGWPLVSTVKEVDEKKLIKATADRSRLWEAQTPQAFRFDMITRAYQVPDKVQATDDAFLAEAAGYKVRMVEGARWNIKITVPEDLAVAEAILRMKDKG